jgi:hypothetical protein
LVPSRQGVAFVPDDRYLAVYRMHRGHKSAVGGDRRRRELATIYARHTGQRYERLFEECCARPTILSIRKWLGRARLSRLVPVVLRAVFPHVFRGFPSHEIGDLLTML